MLLRESSAKVGVAAELGATVGRGGDGGIAEGEAIVRFGEAVTRGSDDVDGAREALRAALGEPGLIEAAGIVGIFNGLVRNADFSGIPLDDGTLHGSEAFRDELGLEGYRGAAQTELTRADASLARPGILGAPIPGGGGD